MRLLIVGAESGTGRLVARTAVERRHEVTALVGGPDRPDALAAGIRTVAGDPLDGGSVSDVVDGAEAVVVTLADPHGWVSPADGTLNVVRSMQRYSVRRLVVLSSSRLAPPGQPGHAGLVARLIDPAVRGGRLDDLRRMEVLVRQSELDWTLVRVPELRDGGGSGVVRAGPGYALPGARPLSRADLARFLLDELMRRDNIQHAVAVSG